jgi:hypothetical protein
MPVVGYIGNDPERLKSTQTLARISRPGTHFYTPAYISFPELVARVTRTEGTADAASAVLNCQLAGVVLVAVVAALR